jgi:hypothetical protein
VVHYARFGDHMQELLADGAGRAGWVPTFWFLGLYQRLLHGSGAPGFAAEMSRRALGATAIAAAVVVVSYPAAWARMRRMAVEDEVSGARRGGWVSRAVNAVIRRPEERAVFHFIGQTMARNSRYQVYLAMYCGTGLALAISCATTMRVVHGVARPGLSEFGLHAVMPLLLFWTVAGLRMAFAFPLNLPARWIFRTTGVELERCVRAARMWAFGCGAGVLAAIVLALRAAGWDARQLIVQAVCGIGLCALLVEGFFFAQSSVPFSRARTPGRTSLPLMLTLYVGVLAPFVWGMMWVERRMERELMLMVWVVAVVPAVHVALRALRERTVLVEEEREGAEGEFQLLGLSGELTS